MTSKKELIRCRDLSVGYDGKAVLHNLNFSVNEGDYLCIVGENGSGKSTLMRTLLHLQPPVDGQLTMDETLHYRIGYLPQQTPVQKDFPERDCSLRMPEPFRISPFLYQDGKAVRNSYDGKTADFASFRTMLSRIIRWTAATGAAREGTLCD